MKISVRQLLSVLMVIGGALILVALFAGRANTQDLNWWTADALLKVRPGDPAPSANPQTVQLYAAQNEFEPFQIVLHANTRDIENIDVQMSDLAQTSGPVITSDHITIYFERYLNLTSPSTQGSETGEWPDPLIPRVDRYFGEKRNAFPFTLASGRNQPIWVEIYVPSDAVPGLYLGKATITADGINSISIPVTLKVWNFALPYTSSLRNAWGFNGLSAQKEHFGKYTGDGDLRSITYLYQKSALWHRISIIGGTLEPPGFTGGVSDLQIQWDAYDAEVEPFLDGTVFTASDPLPGARATSVDLRTNGNASTPDLKVAYWRQFVQHFAAKNWLDRLFYYVWDEPTPQNDPQISSLAALAHTADARIRNLVTTTLDPAIDGVIDIWTPLVNCIDPKPGFPPYCARVFPRSAYDAEIQNGKTLWWYQSCASHGCNSTGGDYFQGWPNYLIDTIATANRIFPWITWEDKISGELYFNTDEAYSASSDAWNNVYLFGGNGDGTFFYGGTPARIGGTTNIPIESIRLKLVREGLEDYEYMVLLSKQGLSSCADQMVSQIVNEAYNWQLDPADLYAARQKMGEMLNTLYNQPSTPVLARQNSMAGGVRKSNQPLRISFNCSVP